MILSVEAKRDPVECMHPKAKQVCNIKKILNIFFNFWNMLHFVLFLAVVIGIYDESMQPQQAATIVEKMSQYLKDAGC